MSQIAKYSTDSNFGAFHTLYICRTADLPDIDENLDNLLLSLNRPFEEIFTAIYFTEATGDYNAVQDSNANGTFWKHNLTFSIPKDRVEVTRALKKFEKKKVSCLIILHNEDEKRLIGSQKYPLQFVSEIKLGKEISDSNTRTLQLKGTSPNEAPRFGGYVEDAGEPTALPDLDVADLLNRVIALEQNLAALNQIIVALQDTINDEISDLNQDIAGILSQINSISQIINNLTQNYNSLLLSISNLTSTTNTHTTQITQIFQTLTYLQTLINQVIAQTQTIIDRRRILAIDLVAGEWTPAIHNFNLVDQDAFLSQLSINSEVVYAPVRSVNNSKVEVYSSETVSAKITLIAVAAITQGKLSTQTVDLIANTWVQVIHSFNLLDKDGFIIRLAYQEETIYAPVRSVNSNTLEIYSSETLTVKAVTIGV